MVTPGAPIWNKIVSRARRMRMRPAPAQPGVASSNSGRAVALMTNWISLVLRAGLWERMRAARAATWAAAKEVPLATE